MFSEYAHRVSTSHSYNLEEGNRHQKPFAWNLLQLLCHTYGREKQKWKKEIYYFCDTLKSWPISQGWWLFLLSLSKYRLKMNPDSKLKSGNGENRSLRGKFTRDQCKNMLSPINLWVKVHSCKNLSLDDDREKIQLCSCKVKAFSRGLFAWLKWNDKKSLNIHFLNKVSV